MEDFKILCPYCNAPYTAEMKNELEYSSGCDTCGYGSEKISTVEIHCTNCKKLVYKKEYEE